MQRRGDPQIKATLGYSNEFKTRLLAILLVFRISVYYDRAFSGKIGGRHVRNGDNCRWQNLEFSRPPFPWGLLHHIKSRKLSEEDNLKCARVCFPYIAFRKIWYKLKGTKDIQSHLADFSVIFFYCIFWRKIRKTPNVIKVKRRWKPPWQTLQTFRAPERSNSDRV